MFVNRTKILVSFLIALFLGFLVQAMHFEAHAAFSLSMTPSRGGRDIRFDAMRDGRTVRNEEVTLAVSTDESKQYRITQTVLRPLTNGQGNTLPEDAIQVFSPSSTSGVLRLKLPQPLKGGTQVVFTSNSAGAGESFILVYAIDPSKIDGSGIYETQISYTLEATQGGVSPVILTRRIQLEVINEFDLIVKNERGGNSLDLGEISQTQTESAGSLFFEIDSNLASRYRVYQQLTAPLGNEKGDVIPADEIQYQLVSATRGGSGNEGRVSQSSEMLYVSDDRGSSTVLEVQYGIANTEMLNAGIYRSQLTFFVETQGGGAVDTPIVTVPVEYEVRPIFYLDVDTGGQASGLEFGRFQTTAEGPRTREVQLKVYNNIGDKYQVSQIASGPMVNDRGDKIRSEGFVFWTEGSSESSFIDRATHPVEHGENIIFVSDDKGSPATLTVNYRLDIPIDQRKGRYSVDLTYSLSSI